MPSLCIYSNGRFPSDICHVNNTDIHNNLLDRHKEEQQNRCHHLAAKPLFPERGTYKESIWIDGVHNLSCFSEEPRKVEFQTSKTSMKQEEKEEEEEGEQEETGFPGGKRTMKLKKLQAKAQEDMLISHSHNRQESHGDNTLRPQALVALLKSCAKQKDLHRGSRIHAHIVKTGLLEKNVFLGSILVSMYAKCGSIAKAQEVFDNLQVCDVVSWNALIAGYAQHGHGKQAIECFERMQREGLSPNAVTFVCTLKACGSIGAVDRGKEIHAQILKDGSLRDNVVVGTALVDMYAKCGLLSKAQGVFDKLPIHNVVSWSALIARYAQHGHGEKALECFEQMQLEGFSPNIVTYICALKACGIVRAADKGKEIHVKVTREGLLKKDVAVGTALVDMYSKCGLLAKAQEVFDKLPVRNVVSWSALMIGYTQHGFGEQALKCFEQMQLEGLSPNAVTYVCILKACGNIGAGDKGKKIHAEIAKEGLLRKDIVVGTALVDMYAKCGLLVEAQKVFDNLPSRDVVLWNALVAGYTQQGCAEQALKCFEQMLMEGFSPDTATFVCVLKACGSIGAADKGRDIQDRIVKQGMLKKDISIGNALVDMYGKCGLLAKAQEVFDELPVRNVVSWSALMAGYAQHGKCVQALKCFEKMQEEGLSPDAVTYTCILKACGSIGDVDKGKEIHAQIVREGLLKTDVAIGNALVDMYAKCGLLEKAQEVFDKLPVRNVVSWSALMEEYALLGKAEYVLNLFDKMIGEGIKPDLVTFTTVLNAFSHTGLLDKAQLYFEIMRTGYGLIPDLGHYTCMINLFARAGHLDKALTVIEKMPYSADLTVWLTILGACQKWGNLKLGRLAFEHAVQLDEKEATAYICMSNIYAAAGRQDDADKIEAMRMEKQERIKLQDSLWTGTGRPGAKNVSQG